jgi:hypothetical protein
MAYETIYDHSTEYMDQRDSEERSSLMICARAGNTQAVTSINSRLYRKRPQSRQNRNQIWLNSHHVIIYFLLPLIRYQ